MEKAERKSSSDPGEKKVLVNSGLDYSLLTTLGAGSPGKRGKEFGLAETATKV